MKIVYAQMDRSARASRGGCSRRCRCRSDGGDRPEARSESRAGSRGCRWKERWGPAGCIYDRLAEIAVEEEAAARRTAEAAAAPLRARGLAGGRRVQRRRPAAAIVERRPRRRPGGSRLARQGGDGSFLLGSVSERVARYAPARCWSPAAVRVQRVILGVDGSASTAGALDLLPGWHCRRRGGAAGGACPVSPREAPAGNEKGRVKPGDRERRAAGDRVVQEALERLRAAGRDRQPGRFGCGPAGRRAPRRGGGGAAPTFWWWARPTTPGPGPLYLGCVSGWVLMHAPCSVLLARSGAALGNEATAPTLLPTGPAGN